MIKLKDFFAADFTVYNLIEFHQTLNWLKSLINTTGKALFWQAKLAVTKLFPYQNNQCKKIENGFKISEYLLTWLLKTKPIHSDIRSFNKTDSYTNQN